MKLFTSRKFYFITGSIIIAISILSHYLFFAQKNNSKYEIAIAERGNIIQEVSITGKVKPAESIDLAFERSGRLTVIYVDIGDKVYAGQILAKLENSDLAAQLAEAEANIKVQQAGLDDLQTGKEADFKKAKQDLENDYSKVLDELNDAYTKGDDAVRVKTANIFTGSKSSSYQLTYEPCNQGLEFDLNNLRKQSEIKLDEWQNDSQNNLDEALKNAKSRLLIINEMLKNVAGTLNSACTAGDPTFDSHRNNISAARANVAMAINNLGNLEQKIASDKITIERIEKETTSGQMQAQKSRIDQAQAQAQNIKAQIGKTIIRSPISGIVTRRNGDASEIASANSPILTIMSGSSFEISANISEIDIAKIKLGDLARVTLDAYRDGDLFIAKVVKIDPTETIIEGVPTYKVTFQFTQKDNRVKSGMTANIDVQSAKKDDVITIPQRAVITRDNKKIVRLLVSEIEKEIEVTTGLRGSDGKIEIISGVSEGDKIILFEK